jgi:putative ABC transport system permease protein
MVWRELSRRPLRLLLSAVGIALAVGILVVARSMFDSMDYLIDVQFHRSMREDVNVTFSTPVAADAVSQLGQLPGVLYAEGLRTVPVRFRSGHRVRDSSILGYPEGARLRRLLDSEGQLHAVPPEGILLTAKLAEILELSVGEFVWVDFREGDWSTERVRVTGLVEEPFGLMGHMHQRTLARLLRDTAPINTTLLLVDPLEVTGVEQRLKQVPLVVGVSSPGDFKRQFDEQSAAMIGVFTFILTIFAGIIAVGVIYNNARVALSQRTRDLGSLRVLGFTQREIAKVLVGEQAVQVALAIPLGLLFGRWLSVAMMSNVDPETYRLPVVVSAQTYVFAVVVTLASALLSALLLRRKLSKLDLIAVLKTRE